MSKQAYADLLAFGATPEEIAKTGVAVEGSEDAARQIHVEPENVDAVRIFVRLQSQWKVSSLSAGRKAVLVYTGLDYTAVPVVAAALGITVDDNVLGKINVMERESMRIREHRLQQSLNAP